MEFTNIELTEDQLKKIDDFLKGSKKLGVQVWTTGTVKDEKRVAFLNLLKDEDKQ